MRKTITTAFLVIGMMANAQQYTQKYNKRDTPKFAFVSIGFDVRNAFTGSKPTNSKPALDGQIKLGAAYKSAEVAMFYENFDRIEFQAYGVNVNYVTEVAKNFDVVAGIEAGSIIRYKDFNFLMVGVNGELRYDFGKFMIGSQGNYRLRNDVDSKNKEDKKVFSWFLNLTYKFN